MCVTLKQRCLQWDRITGNKNRQTTPGVSISVATTEIIKRKFVAQTMTPQTPGTYVYTFGRSQFPSLTQVCELLHVRRDGAQDQVSGRGPVPQLLPVCARGTSGAHARPAARGPRRASRRRRRCARTRRRRVLCDHLRAFGSVT